jgi:uncharacterized protein YqeY
MLRSKIQDDLTTALKSRDQNSLNILRMVMSAIKYKEVEKKEELNDDEVLQVIKKQVKELNESIEAFTKGNRMELAKEYEAQLSVLTPYLPKEMSDDELKTAVDEIIAKNNDLYQKNPKVIIGLCMKELRNKADPQKIMQILNSK